ncbi:MAG: FKBP-type peptidyl-prolyl cis-trans isomerase [Patescibacteria group bacterium]
MGTRVISLLLAISFFVSVAGFTIFVIIEANQDDTDNTQQLSNTFDISENNNQQSTDQGANTVLAGTILDGFDTRDNGQTAELEITDIVEGTGDAVSAADVVTVHYTGALVRTGEIFESSKDSGSPATFGLTNLIVGWQEGIPGMKPGGTRRLVIPATKAYGDNPRPGGLIQPGDDLVFDIELIGITE